MSNQYRIAATIMAPTIPEMVARGIQAIKEGADLPEFRIDSLNLNQVLLEGGRANFLGLTRLTREFKGDAIYTNRHKNEAPPGSGQGFKGTERQRVEILQELANLNVRYLDIEHKIFPGERRSFKTDPTKTLLIRSYHNFLETPNINILENIFYDMTLSFESDIVKIATMAKKEEDVQNIMQLIDKHSYSHGLIAIAMGEMGKETRFDGPVRGTYLTYGCLEGMSAAPAMPTIKELRQYYAKK
jgi:3-dehydroquinate dehydratase type I